MVSQVVDFLAKVKLLSGCPDFLQSHFAHPKTGCPFELSLSYHIDPPLSRGFCDFLGIFLPGFRSYEARPPSWPSLHHAIMSGHNRQLSLSAVHPVCARPLTVLWVYQTRTRLSTPFLHFFIFWADYWFGPGKLMTISRFRLRSRL